MTREKVLDRLRAHESELRQRGVLHAGVFGSVARGEQGARSDIDILIELDPAREIDVYAYVGIKRFVGELFPAPVDVVDLAALRPGLGKAARRDAAHAF
jgi:predicted nucleotidyltransferase